MPEAKIKLKLSGVEFSYEGPGEFLGESIVELCEKLLELDAPEIAIATSGSTEAPNSAKPSISMSVTDIAVKLGSKSGSDLVMAAAANLTFSADKEEFSRSELLTAMKTAKSFYKQTYSNNLSKSLDSLVKAARLSNPGNERYALPHGELENLRTSLGF